MRRPTRTRSARATRQRGFTLIELMVALVVSSLLIGMILSIFTRMSMAYRAQQNVAELQQTLAAAQALVQREIRQTGYQIPDGFLWAGAPAVTQQPLQVTNNADNFGPDLIRVFHADASAQARVDTTAVGFAAGVFDHVTVDDRDLFEVGDLVVMVGALTETAVDALGNTLELPNGAKWIHYRACVLKISDITGNVISFETSAPWGRAGNTQCDDVRPIMSHPDAVTRMLYRFSARAFRIDPARRQLAVLQMSPSGGLVAGDWQDLGVGFTDLQVATRWNDYWSAGARAVDTADADDNALIEWYSGEQQEAMSAPIATNDPNALYFRSVAAEARVSLVVRTIKAIDAVPTSATPSLIDTTRPDNNDLGDRAAVVLAGVPDASRAAELRGTAVFRHATIGADLRNMAVGQ